VLLPREGAAGERVTQLAFDRRDGIAAAEAAVAAGIAVAELTRLGLACGCA
jgi:hypothetical protein